MNNLPRITVVTPSYNQAGFLRASIESVLSQGYPNLEYIVVDGGSTDASPAIIEEYAESLAWWVTEPDNGQSHALNKGFGRATGDVLGWLNSDDKLLPGSLATIGATLHDTCGPQALVGHCRYRFANGATRVMVGRFDDRQSLLEVWRPYTMHQPAVWWRREAADRTGLLDESLSLVMDFDYWVRMAEHTDFVNVDAVLAEVVAHAEAKTGGDNFRAYHRDQRRLALRYLALRPGTPRWASAHANLLRRRLVDGVLRKVVGLRRAVVGESREHVTT